MSGLSATTASPFATPGLGSSQRAVLETFKRQGESTLAQLELSVELAVETVRSHLQALEAQGLIERAGLERSGPGRPRVRYRLAAAGEALFPRGEGDLLRDLAAYLIRAGHTPLLEAFFEERLERKRSVARARLVDVPAEARPEAVAQLLSEEGFLAEVTSDDAGLALRLCHCPLRAVVDVTRLPCRAELALVRELLGDQPLERVSFIPDGAACCTYRIGQATPHSTATDQASVA